MLRLAIAVGVTVGIVLLAVSLVVTDAATGHVQLHAMSALVALAIAGALVIRWPGTGLASGAPATGLVLLAAALLVEAVGAFGFATDNDTRQNGLVVAHDLGLGLTAVGLLAVIVGAGIGAGAASSRRPGRLRWAGMAAAILGVGGGFLVVKALIGM